MKTTRILVIATLIAGTGLTLLAARAQQVGTRRTDLQRHDLSIPGREVVQAIVDLEPGTVAPRHSHPGEEIIYVLEGTWEYTLEGKPPVVLKAGEVLFIPAGVIHSARNIGAGRGRELATYVVEKDKPLLTPASGHANEAGERGEAAGEAAPVFAKIPDGYRDWRLISVAREEGDLDDIRAVLGNDAVIDAYRQGTRPFPDGTVISRLAWSYDSSEENNKAFGRRQSFVAGHPKNGVQFMVKDSKKYASTGGWGYAQFTDGEPLTDQATLQRCFDCHQAARDRERDFVFTRYAP